jgi:protein-tyrosine phosphatase
MVCLEILSITLAEGILASKLPAFTVDSAGTGDWHIGHADARSIAGKKSPRINQKGRQFKVADFEIYDYIYNGSIHYKNDQSSKRGTHKTETIILNELYPNENVDVPDPISG